MVDVQMRGDDPDDDKDYEVGYKKPPKSGQFKPGHGRSRGRRKGSKNIKTLFEAEMFALMAIKVDGRKRKMSVMQVIFHQIKTGALQRDPKMIATAVALAQRLCPPPDETEDVVELTAEEEELFRDHNKMMAYLAGDQGNG